MFTLYKANKRATGCIFSVTAKTVTDEEDSKKNGMFFSFKNQTGWDDKNQAGVFQNGKSAIIKFGITEIGLFKRCLRDHRNVKEFNKGMPIYHDNGETKTLINFGWEEKNAKGEALPNPYSCCRIKRGEDLFQIAFTPGEEEVLLNVFDKIIDSLLKCNEVVARKKAEKFNKGAVRKPNVPAPREEEELIV